MPKGWSFVQGAAFLVQSLTAYYGLKSLGDIKARSFHPLTSLRMAIVTQLAETCSVVIVCICACVTNVVYQQYHIMHDKEACLTFDFIHTRIDASVHIGIICI